ncbi:ATP-grasp domain-containing protein [bacterium]|nr:ATP-grasp domain-containing protein [bacterium]
MKLALLCYLASWENKQILKEALRRGHQAKIFLFKNLCFYVSEDKFEVKDKEGESLLDYEVFLFRGTVGFREYALPLGLYLARKGKVLVSENFAQGVVWSNKFEVYERLKKGNVPLLPSYFPTSKKIALRVLKKMNFPCVFKRFQGSWGQEVRKFSSYEEASAFIRQHKEFKNWVIQEFLPYEKDLRIFVLGYKALGAIERVRQQKEEFRANVSLGAEPKAIEVSSELLKLAERCARLTLNEICGVDLLLYKGKPYVVEVNRNAQFKGFSRATGINVAREIVKYLEQKYEAPSA